MISPAGASRPLPLHQPHPIIIIRISTPESSNPPWLGAQQIERQESFKDLLIGQVVRPGVGGEDGGIQFLMGEIESVGTEVVGGCEGALFAVSFGSEPGEW